MNAITLPKTLTSSKLIETLEENRVFDQDWDRLSLVFSAGCHIYVNAMAFLCSWGLLQRRKGRAFVFPGKSDTLRYVSRMDLFKHLGFDYEETFDRHTEAGRFIPLRLINDDNDVMGTVDAICDLLIHQFENARDFLPAFEWSVYEIIDNIILHSDTPVPGIVCAQFYPELETIDVAVCDMGRGVMASLSESYDLFSHGDAITKALERGATRNPDAGQGNGLAGTYEIARLNEGSFRIWSGDVSFKLSPGRTEGRFEKLGTEVPGVGVNIRLKTSKPVPMSDTFMGRSNWTYIEKVSERLEEQGLKVIGECNHTGGRRPARYLRIKIENLLPDMEDVLRLDFSGVKSCSSSFLDELLGRMIADIGPDTFNEKVEMINATDDIVDMANVVIHQRLEAEELDAETTWRDEDKSKVNINGSEKMGNAIELAGIEYRFYDSENLPDKKKVLEDRAGSLFREFGIFKYNPKAASILNKRAAASIYIKIADKMDMNVDPCRESRIFTMACMGHFKKNSKATFTGDFIKNCDDIYIKHAALGYYEQDPKHEKWVKKALSDLNSQSVCFACDLFADIYQLDSDAVRSALLQPKSGSEEQAKHPEPRPDKTAPIIPAAETKAEKNAEPEQATQRAEPPSGNGDLLQSFMELSCDIVKCANYSECREICGKFDEDPPQPGFIGRNYRGLVIIGANPGKGKGRSVYDDYNAEYYSLADKFASSRSMDDYLAYLEFTAQYMGIWAKHLCNSDYRQLLGYDIEDIAYVNIVKCRSYPGASDVIKNLGVEVCSKCSANHLKKQIEILKPRYIVGHWLPVFRNLQALGFDISQYKTAAMNGAHNITKEERINDIKPIFDESMLR